MRLTPRLSDPIKVFLLSALVFGSCTPTTGTRTPLGPTDLSKIKSLSLTVKKEEDFSVRLSREEMTATGAVLFGLLGAGIEAAARHSSDTRVEEQFKPILADYDPTRSMIEKLRYYLQSSGSFRIVAAEGYRDAVSAPKELDGVLEMTLREWGLRRCPGPSPDRVQVGLNIYARMLLTEGGSTVWERDEIYRDGECRPWQEFRSQERLLNEVLSRTIDNLSGKIVNELLFP